MDPVLSRPYAVAPMGRLEGRAVLVTGATSGIGRAIARRCVLDGADVLATGRDEARLAELAQEYPSVAVHPADLTGGDAAGGCTAAAVSRFGRLDGLVHAAGIVRRGEDIRNTTDREWSLLREANLDVTFRLARASLREMVPQH
jgi:3-oxoacyl-[acyl-carrier protein] reductase